MSALLIGAAGLASFGPGGCLLGVGWLAVQRLRRPHRPPPPIRSLLLVLLVELRSGYSVLAALGSAASRFSGWEELGRSVRIARVAGLEAAVDDADGELRLLMIQLSRARITGSSAADAVRRLLDSGLARERAARLAAMRSLPVRLMVPVALLILPGVILISYGPTIVSLLSDLVVPFG